MRVSLSHLASVAVLLYFSINCAESAKSNTTVNQVFQLPEYVTSEGQCFKSPLSKQPELLRFLRSILENPTSKMEEQVQTAWLEITRRLSHPELEIDAQSLYFQQTQRLENPNQFHGQEKLTNYVGAELQTIRVFKHQEVSEFFSSVFRFIVTHSKEWNATDLSRADLFHGHLVLHKENRDLYIVFHAKEYPRGEPTVEPGLPRSQFLNFFHESLNGEISLHRPTSRFTRRNFIWSFRENRICGVDTTTPTFQSLSKDLEDPNPGSASTLEEVAALSTLDQNKASDLGEKGSLLDLYYFPKENVPVFLSYLAKGNPFL